MSETARKRCCGNCVFSERPKGRWLRAILSRWPGLLICFRCAKRPGEMREVAATDVCENFREQPAPPLRVEPPEPPSEDIRYIPLTKGKHAIVDAADFDELNRHRWYTLGDKRVGLTYAVRKVRGQTIYMHRELMKPAAGMVVDHIDGNPLNNRRGNLRVCTQLQNAQNQRRRVKPGCRFVGVHPVGDKWQAIVIYKRRTYYVGTFDDEVEAALARDRKKLELAGEFATLNFPQHAEPTSEDS